MFRKLFKCAFWVGVFGIVAVVALQFDPVRDAAKKVGLNL